MIDCLRTTQDFLSLCIFWSYVRERFGAIVACLGQRMKRWHSSSATKYSQLWVEEHCILETPNPISPWYSRRETVMSGVAVTL